MYRYLASAPRIVSLNSSISRAMIHFKSEHIFVASVGQHGMAQSTMTGYAAV